MGVFGPSAYDIAEAQSERNYRDRLREVQEAARHYRLEVYEISPDGRARVTMHSSLASEKDEVYSVEVVIDSSTGSELRSLLSYSARSIAEKILKEKLSRYEQSSIEWAIRTLSTSP